MECGALVGALLALAVVIVVPIMTLVLWVRQRRGDEVAEEVDRLRRRVSKLESEISTLKERPPEVAKPAEPAAAPVAATAPLAPPPVPPVPVEPPRPFELPASAFPAESAKAPPLVDRPAVLRSLEAGGPPPPPPRKPINWENFLGVKLFAWVGGIVAFLAAAFFIKYSFEHDLVPPAVRIAMGLAAGIGLLVGGLRLDRTRYAALQQSLAGSGVLILYGSLFGAHALYHLIPPLAAFGSMCLVTAVAFLVAVRFDAPAVAVLGMIGGFLTPPLLSSGRDNPVGLFGYVALLDVGVAAVVLRRRWTWLLVLAALGTAVMQAGWTARYFETEKAPTAFVVYAGFPWLFAGAFAFLCRRGGGDRSASAGVLIPVLAALCFLLRLLLEPYREVLLRPLPLFTFVFVADAALLLAVWVHAPLRPALPAAGGLLFAALWIWFDRAFGEALLLPAMAVVLVFAVLHGIVPALVQRLRPAGRAPLVLNLFPALALVLVLSMVSTIPGVSLGVWAGVLLLDAAALLMAVVTGTLLGVLSVLALTVVGLGLALFRIPQGITGLPGELLLVAGFGAAFFVAGSWAARRLKGALLPGAPPLPDAVLPGAAILLPFFLLAAAAVKILLPDPSPIFGIALFILLLAFAAVARQGLDVVGACALAALALLEFAWRGRSFDRLAAGVPLGWAAGFLALVLAFVFAFKARLQARVPMWAAAALFGPVQFFLAYSMLKESHPNPYMGLLPAALALPYLAGTVALARIESPARLAILSWFGGTALFFITAVFPVQFDRQWITVGWALEGAALLWLWRRLPHEGLRIAGAGLLVAATARLLPGLNPFVLAYHAREAAPILNWILYTYGICAAALFAGARLVDPAKPRILNLPARPVLEGCGTLVLFLLLNLEIADFFSGTATHITFRFSGNLAQDMTYSIAWALFAFGLLVAGIWRGSGPARWTGLGLLVVTLCKLFLHDLWRLGGLYRIGSLLGLAVVLLTVSFVYQRFLVPKKESAP